MKFDRFEDIIAWQKAKLMTVTIYKNLKDLRDYGFRDQINRASVSVMNNIAEGFERKSNVEFKHFLFIAKGSCGEVRSMLNLARELEYLKNDDFINLNNISEEVSKMISALIKSLN